MMNSKRETSGKSEMDRRALLTLLGQASVLWGSPTLRAGMSLQTAKTEDRVQKLFERLGHGLSTGDLKEVSACFGYPALIFLDRTGVSVNDAAEIERLFARASEDYRAHGIVSTRPKIERLENLNESLAAVDVRWPSYDESGKEKASELSHYILDREDPRIRVALSRTA